MLDEVLMILGAKKPFKKNGELTVQGEKAFEKLLEIQNCLKYMGALGKSGTELANYLEEIIRLGF